MSTTSNVTLLIIVGVLVAVYLSVIGDCKAFFKALGFPVDFTGVETSIWFTGFI